MTGPSASTPGASTGPRARPDDGLMGSLRRFWDNEDPKVAIPRDIGVSVFAIAILILSIWAYSGQPFPDRSPMVVVESGSMMHPEAGYGRVGTIDPGDLIFVKAVESRDDVETAYGDGERTGFGGNGDVIVFMPGGNPFATPIIHRAMTWVEVVPTSDPGASSDTERPYVYDYVDERGILLTNQKSVTLPSLGLNGKHFDRSGFVTRGDNPQTNRVADQVGIVAGQLIEEDWIIGKARGEVPWLGLLKLGMTGNQFPADPSEQCKVARAWAPCDTWNMLGLSIAGAVLVPFALDMWVRRRDQRLAAQALGKDGGDQR